MLKHRQDAKTQNHTENSLKGLSNFLQKKKKMSKCQKIKNYKPLTKLKAKQNTRSK